MALMRVGDIGTQVGELRFSPAGGKTGRVAYAPAARAEPWLLHFRCSARDLAVAVKAVGTDPLDVGVYLERRC